MRTKLLLGAALLAAGAISAMADNVYSLNIVGYVNVQLPGNNAYKLVGVPLKPSNGDYNITNTIVMPNAAQDASLLSWAGTAWDTTVPTWYTDYGWFPDMVVPFGKAVFIQSPIAGTVTFVGEVSLTNNVSFDPGYNLVVNQVPAAERWPGATVGQQDDSILTWDETAQAWNTEVFSFFDGYGWFSGGPTDDIGGPAVNPAQGMFYNNTKVAPYAWSRTFVVP